MKVVDVPNDSTRIAKVNQLLRRSPRFALGMAALDLGIDGALNVLHISMRPPSLVHAAVLGLVIGITFYVGIRRVLAKTAISKAPPLEPNA